MKKIIAFSALLIMLPSCKKDKVASTSAYTYVHTSGSYWVYDWYQVDAAGNETLIPAWKDTIRIVGDTSINGNVYQVLRGRDMGSPITYYTRDSSGYIVAAHGGISYSYISSPMLLNTVNDGYLIQKSYIGEKQTLSTAFGNKTASTTYLEISREDGSPMTSCDDPSVRFYHHYVSGIGLVQKEKEYLSLIQSQCSRKRAKLTAYYVAP